MPQGSHWLWHSFVDFCHQILLLHHPEPGDGTQGSTQGDDIDGDDVHPGAPLGDGLQVHADAQAHHAQQNQHNPAAEAGEAVLQGFAHGLKHILQGADPGENQSGVQNHGKETTQGDVLQNPGQGHKQQGRAGTYIQTIGEAGGYDDQGGDQSGNGVKQGGAQCQRNHRLPVIQIGTVDDHAAAGDRQGEEGLSHGPDPDHGAFQGRPVRGEQKPVALAGPGEEGHPDCQNHKDQEEQGHHNPVGFFDADGSQQQGQQRTHHHDHMEGQHGIGPAGKAFKPPGGVHVHQRPGEGVKQSIEHVGNNDCVAQGNAQ